MNKDMASVVRQLSASGYQTKTDGRGHLVLLTGEGEPVRDERGLPITLPSTPSDRRWRANLTARLSRAGVTMTGKAAPMHTSAAKARAKATLAARHEQNQEATRLIKVRLEKCLIDRLGGWDRKGVPTRVGEVLFHYLGSRNRVEKPKSLSAALQQAHVIKTGGAIGPVPQVGWDLLISDLEKSTDPVTRFHELLAESRGEIKKTETVVVKAREEQPKLEPAGEDRISLVLEAMWFMSRGAGPEDRVEVERIARGLL